MATMSKKPLLLDLFCGAGGAARGYADAGFDVIGVDIKPQPRYPFRMVVADSMKPPFELGMFDAIHASPPCQRYSRSSRHAADERGYPDLVHPTRDMLVSSGRPWVIENVVGAPLYDSIVLCGVQFGLWQGQWFLSRHRLFESSHVLWQPPHEPHPRNKAPLCIAGNGPPAWVRARIEAITGRRTQPKAVCHQAMQIDWMTWKQLTQAIPPAYTAFIGKQLLTILENERNG